MNGDGYEEGTQTFPDLKMDNVINQMRRAHWMNTTMTTARPEYECFKIKEPRNYEISVIN